MMAAPLPRRSRRSSHQRKTNPDATTTPMVAATAFTHAGSAALAQDQASAANTLRRPAIVAEPSTAPRSWIHRATAPGAGSANAIRRYLLLSTTSSRRTSSSAIPSGQP